MVQEELGNIWSTEAGRWKHFPVPLQWHTRVSIVSELQEKAGVSQETLLLQFNNFTKYPFHIKPWYRMYSICFALVQIYTFLFNMRCFA